jgi:hypothetical protein
MWATCCPAAAPATGTQVAPPSAAPPRVWHRFSRHQHKGGGFARPSRATLYSAWTAISKRTRSALPHSCRKRVTARLAAGKMFGIDPVACESSSGGVSPSRSPPRCQADFYDTPRVNKRCPCWHTGCTQTGKLICPCCLPSAITRRHGRGTPAVSRGTRASKQKFRAHL